MHDRAFEAGLFTLTQDYRIALNHSLVGTSPWAQTFLSPHEAEQIALGTVPPSHVAISQHWERIGFTPAPNTANQ
jgi:predicted restriction endonuclease